MRGTKTTASVQNNSNKSSAVTESWPTPENAVKKATSANPRAAPAVCSATPMLMLPFCRVQAVSMRIMAVVRPFVANTAGALLGGCACR